METSQLIDPAPQPANPPPRAGRINALLRTPLLWVILVALLLHGIQWLDSRMKIAEVQAEVARRLAEGENRAKEDRTLARQNQEVLAGLQGKVGMLESRLAEAQSQALALEAMYQELSSTRGERLLAEVEQAVSIAMQQLQFAGNVEAALIALQSAEGRLARAGQPQFLQVRKLIANDIERLKATPGGDITGLSLKIESVVLAADTLPLAFEQRPQPASGNPATGANAGASASSGFASGDFWRSLGNELWQELRQLIRVERIEHGDPLLLSPTQSFFLRENLKLRLLNARLALMQRDGKTFRDEIRQSREQLERHFNTRAKSVEVALGTLRSLAATDVNFDLPGLSQTLAAVRSIKFAQPRSGVR